MVNEAALLAARHDRNAVTMSDFEEAILQGRGFANERIAGAILAHNQPLLTEMAQVLLEREILDGQQLHDYLVGGASPLENRVNIPPVLATWLQTGEISILVPRGSANDPRMVEIGKIFNSQHLQENSQQ